jgi:high-affinity iron transporter
MLAAAIIVFREVLEAALIVGIVMAAARSVPGRGRWVGLGIAAGVLGAALVAGFAETISEAAAGMGQEMLNAAVLFAAVAMLGWHNVWMGRHACEMTAQMGAVGSAVQAGERPLYALAVVVGVAVLREGSEVVLFLYGLAATQAAQGGAAEMLAGGLLGLAAGVVVGLATYGGLLRVPTRRLFAVTSGLIVLLASGMAAQGAGFLMQAGLLPSLGGTLWDTSWLLSETSIPGRVLHTLVGYVAQPDGTQLVFYLGTLLTIVALMRLVARRPAASSRPVTVTR